MPNINAFQPVVYETKGFEDLSKLSLFCPLLVPKFRWNWPNGSWADDV